jgi:hypothetical protein
MDVWFKRTVTFVVTVIDCFEINVPTESCLIQKIKVKLFGIAMSEVSKNEVPLK